MYSINFFFFFFFHENFNKREKADDKLDQYSVLISIIRSDSRFNYDLKISILDFKYVWRNSDLTNKDKQKQKFSSENYID